MSRKRYTDDSTAFCTVSEFCRRSGLSQKHIRQLLHDGSLPFIRCGNTYLISSEKAIAALEQEASANTGK